jgi:hypothetical protein
VPHRRCTNLQVCTALRQVGDRLLHRLDRALHVALDDQRQDWRAWPESLRRLRLSCVIAVAGRGARRRREGALTARRGAECVIVCLGGFADGGLQLAHVAALARGLQLADACLQGPAAAEGARGDECKGIAVSGAGRIRAMPQLPGLHAFSGPPPAPLTTHLLVIASPTHARAATHRAYSSSAASRCAAAAASLARASCARLKSAARAVRAAAIACARASLAATESSSPAAGRPLRPATTAWWPGPTASRGSPRLVRSRRTCRGGRGSKG